MPLYTTLAKIRAHKPCELGWVKLLKHLGKTKPDDKPLALSVVLKSNGMSDTLWCLRACDGAEMFSRRFALDMAKRVYPLWHAKYPNDSRVKDCIATVERFLAGKASKDELQKARAAAYAAATAAYADATAPTRFAADAAYAAAAATAADADATAATRFAADAAYAAYGAAAATAAERKWQTKHLAACLKAWPKGKWPALAPLSQVQQAAE